MLSAQPFEVDNFLGGLNEDPTGDKTQYFRADNLFLTTEQNWISRPGSVLFDLSNAQLPTGNQRVGTLINFNKDDYLFAHSGNRIFYYDSAWVEATGPTGNHALIGGDVNGYLSVAEWKKHLFITSDEQLAPIKLYDDGTGFKAVTAGLPKMATPNNYVSSTVLASAVTFVNSVKSKMLSHFADTTGHVVADSVSAAIITAPNATDLQSTLTLLDQLIRAYISHYNDSNGIGVYHTAFVTPATTGTWGAQFSWSTLTNTVAPIDLPSACATLNELKLRLNIHMGIVSIHQWAISPTFVTDNAIYNATSGPTIATDYSLFYTMANQIKSRYNGHLADGGAATKPHSTAVDGTNTVSTADASTPETLQQLIWDLRLSYGGHGFGGSPGHEYDAQLAAGWSYHVAKESSNHNLPSGMMANAHGVPDYYGGVRAGDWENCAAALNELKDVMNAHMRDLGAHYTNDPTAFGPVGYSPVAHLITAASITLANYNYAFVYKHSYNAGGITFENRSEPLYIQASDIVAIGIENAIISNIPSLSNGSSTNYDTANITVEIYRTVDGGTTYYYVDEIPNGTTSYSDGVTDIELQARGQTLYTSGGVLPNSLPPQARYIHIVNDFAYYANLIDNPNRIQQSISAQMDSCPGSLFVDLPNEVTGISSIRGILVGWTATSTYRIEGAFDDNGQGSMNHVAISNQTGMPAPHSPVQTDEGLVFAGSDGFYITDGYQVKKINRLWRNTYLNLISTPAKCLSMVGTYDRANKRAWWCVNAASSDNDSCYVLDLNFPVTENSVFTSASGGSNFAPSAMAYFDGQMVRGDTRGYVFKHDPSYTNDPKVNTGSAASTWTTAWITYNFESPAYDFGTTQVRKWIPWMTLKALNTGTNLSLQLTSNNDTGRVVSNLTPIRYRGGNHMIEEKRKFPAGSLRCGSKQIGFTNAKVAITNSDSLGQATLNRSLKRLTLNIGNWPTDLADQVVALNTDGYVREWAIVSVSGNVMTLSDPGNTLPGNGSYYWVVRGYPKDEKIQIVSYCLQVSLLAGPSQQSAQGESGENS